ncbi:uncharacterized protein N7459_000658 [Penicillium hispanicum]|uniref:uncharacterized protein n=1 Tax=Penicillium hispanicum TaxID=1080232 RepID=UPI00254008D0|nr:uncharacterized protein N7459_000658 [Penicillium hispanicum]KAJ5594450.1 hypothetical protein N7459_000658 [Penicillium hispanicum]
MTEIFSKEFYEATSHPDKATEALWQHSTTPSNLAATGNEILLPMNVVELIGWPNVRKLQRRFSVLLNRPVSWIEDESISAVRLLPTPPLPHNFSPFVLNAPGPGQMRYTDSMVHNYLSRQVHHAMLNGDCKLPSSSTKVPRPPNSFILYRQHHHHTVTAENPDLKITEISRIIAAKWRSESPEVREQFKVLADQMKRQHAIDHPDYQYSPRRPGEKPRRRSRIHGMAIPFIAAHTAGQTRLAQSLISENPGFLDVDDGLIDMLDDADMIFGPNSIAPVSVPDNEAEFARLVQDQLNRIPAETVNFQPLNGNEFDPNLNLEELLQLE